MENGDWKRVSQHRAPGICPDHLDLLLVVARSGGSDVPPAVHVSTGGLVPLVPGLVPLVSGLSHAPITALM